MKGKSKRIAESFVAEIDEAELTLRIAEIGIGLKRPVGMTAEQALAHLGTTTDPYAAKVIEDFHRMARMAIHYFGECINAGKVPS